MYVSMMGVSILETDMCEDPCCKCIFNVVTAVVTLDASATVKGEFMSVGVITISVMCRFMYYNIYLFLSVVIVVV